jgi:hypothetical protein
MYAELRSSLPASTLAAGLTIGAMASLVTLPATLLVFVAEQFTATGGELVFVIADGASPRGFRTF